MLYINENEKKHIKSLYYTKVINEQGYNQNITGSYVQPATNYNQLNATTQDTTNPIYYKSKVNPNQPNLKYTK
jgi:hypothetical protein